MRRAMMCAALSVGCYHPTTERTCEVSCPTGVCPSGMTCGTDGLCRSSPSDDCSTIADAKLSDTFGGVCSGTGFIRDFCYPPPAEPVVFNGMVLMTNDSNCFATRMQANGTKLCFFVYSSITITGSLRVTGPNPAVLVGMTGIVIRSSGVLDVSSKNAMAAPGAGASEARDCALSTALDGTSTTNAGAGAAGGTFTTRGGNGGDGVNSSIDVLGAAAATSLVTVNAVRGGCPGGTGGSTMTGGGGIGGYGGGAVYLMSNGLIQVEGRINASGAGGGAGMMQNAGSGGGGTGGFIGLDSPAYELSTGLAYAVGGSGGAGASPNGGGVAGIEATGALAPGITMSAGTGGNGGTGAATGDAGAGTSATTMGGGGGGGGGTGFIGIAGAFSSGPGFAPAPLPM